VWRRVGRVVAEPAEVDDLFHASPVACCRDVFGRFAILALEVLGTERVNEVIDNGRVFDGSRHVVSGARVALKPVHARLVLPGGARDGRDFMLGGKHRKQGAADDPGGTKDRNVHCARP
jgi:hypothetical protein